MGVATGGGCKEVYRFPHSTYPYSSCICSFLQQHPYFLFIFNPQCACARVTVLVLSVCLCVFVFPILAPRAIRRTNSSISYFSAIRA